MRIWIKGFRVADTPEGQEAREIITEWTFKRQRPGHFIRAIRIYAGLLRGDLGPLREYFPGVGLNAGTAPIMRRNVPIAVALVEKTETEDLDDFFGSMGM